MDSVSGVAGSNFSRRYRFADLTIDVGQRRLLRAGEEIALSKLSYELMRVLVEAAPNLVTHEELAARVWGPRRIVTPENLAKRVMMLRQALGDHADAPRYIEGVRGQGYRLVPAVEIVDSATRAESTQGTSRRWKARYAVAGLVLMALALVGAVQYASRDTERASIALLRCENQSAAGEDAGFIGVGLRNELLTQLGRISALRVVESTPVGQHGSKPRMRDVGRQLGVASVFTCTVQRAGDTLLIHAALFDTVTEEQRWAERYERELSANSLFTVQSDIATSVASVLKVRLTPPEAAPSRPTDDIRAYELYVKGANAPIFTPADATRVIGQLDRALELDPNFVEALAARAGRRAQYEAYAPSDEAAQLAAKTRRDAQRAAEQRPRDVLIRATNALVLDTLGDWVAAEREWHTTFDLGGRRANLGYIQHNLALGYFDEARRDAEASLERDVINPYSLGFLLAIHGLLGDTDKEVEVFARGEELHGDAWFGRLHELWFQLARTGSVDASWSNYWLEHDWTPYLDSPHAGIEEVEKLARTEEYDKSYRKIHLALFAAQFGDNELAMQLLNDAFEHTAMNAWFIWLPQFQGIRGRPEFEQLLEHLGLVDYWEKFGWPDFCSRFDGHIRCTPPVENNR